MVGTIYHQLSPAEVRGQLERVVEQLLEPFPQVAEQLAEQHDECAEARPKGKSGGTEFAQPLLRELIIAQRTKVREQVFSHHAHPLFVAIPRPPAAAESRSGGNVVTG